VKGMRDDQKISALFQSVFGDDFNDQGDGTERDTSEPAQGKRKICRPSRLNDFVILEHIETRNESPKVEQCSLYNSVIDRCVVEIEARFSENNITLLRSLKSLASLDDNFLNPSDLKKIADLCTVDLQKCSSEIEAAKAFFMRKNYENVGCLDNIHKLTAFAHTYRDAFPSVYRLLAAGLTIGSSSSTCEATFSTLSRILTPYRRSMLHARKANLILLAYKHVTTCNIKSDEFLKRFTALKNRRLQLF